MALGKSVKEIIAEDKTGLLSKHASWERVCLRDVFKILNGFPFDSSGFSGSEGTPIIRIRDVVDGETDTFYTGNYDEQFLIDRGDFLVGMDGDFNSARWKSKPALLNQRVCKISATSTLYSEKLLEYVLPGFLSAIHASTSAITVKHLSSTTIGDIELPLPPLSEQIRIVEKLEELLSDLDAGVAELKAAQKKLGQYRHSLLKAAVQGTLTAEWRKSQKAKTSESGAKLLQRILRERRACWEARQLEKFQAKEKVIPKHWQTKYPEPVTPSTTGLPALPQGWVWATVDQLSIEQKYGTSSKTNSEGVGVPIVRMGNIQDGELDLKNLKYLPHDHHEFPALYLQDGDLLFNRTNSSELVGKTAVYRKQLVPCSYASYLIGIHFADSFIPELASAVINSSYGRRWVKSVATQQVGQANVNGSKLAALAIPVPPFDEQQEIVRVLSEQRAIAFEQSKSLDKSLKQSAAQRKNILQTAFSGQLVPQDPADEPASELLKRIRIERAARTANKSKRPIAKKTK